MPFAMKPAADDFIRVSAAKERDFGGAMHCAVLGLRGVEIAIAPPAWPTPAKPDSVAGRDAP
ncbi:MAG: hypothetical protein K2X87_01085 [Gemmataceae bacterium]|nr:hypothetical protein [Gemmataceae bacterium]